MKPFTKRLALVMGLLFTALICMGIVYIDSVKHYWQFSGGFVRLVVNTNAQASFTVDTNTFRVGINTNNATFGVGILGALPPTNTLPTTATGTSANSSGAVIIKAGSGGNSIRPTTGTGGVGGRAEFLGGDGGDALVSQTNATGGAGGTVLLKGGFGGALFGASAGIATNQGFGGAGGAVNIQGGDGVGPFAAATNTQGGAGGALVFQGGAGATPSVGWARQGGSGGIVTMLGGAAGSGTRTNAGDGGSFIMRGGDAGSVGTAPGNPGVGGFIELTGGAGGTGDTNSNGRGVFLRGGNPGSTATPGNVYLGRNPSGSARGGVVIGLGEFTITNMLGGSASLDFPSTAAGTFSDLRITVTGTTSNGCSVVMGIPWEMAQIGGAFTHYESNDAVFIRFINNQLVTAIDPSPATVTVVVLKNQ